MTNVQIKSLAFLQASWWSYAGTVRLPYFSTETQIWQLNIFTLDNIDMSLDGDWPEIFRVIIFLEAEF